MFYIKISFSKSKLLNVLLTNLGMYRSCRFACASPYHALGLARVFLKVFPFNARAIHVYEKCGFREYDRTEDDVFMEITA